MFIFVYVQYYGDYEEGYDVDFAPRQRNSKKTITDHSRNVIVILYIVFILNMVYILKVCTCKCSGVFSALCINHGQTTGILVFMSSFILNNTK